MQVRSATVNDAQAITDLHLADNRYGGWFRNPIRHESPCRYEDLTPFQRMLHGGDWMDVSLCRRHIHEYISRGYPILAAEEGGRVVGECELWLADEGPPFGKYTAIEMLMTHHNREQKDVEMALVGKAEERCRKLGVPSLDVSPQHGGDSLDWEDIGFIEIADTRTCDIELKSMDEPDFDFTVKAEAEDYEVVRPLLAWNHREPAQLNFEFNSGIWPPVKMAGFDRHEKRLFVRVNAESFGLEYVLRVMRPDWDEEAYTAVDIWSKPAAVRRKAMSQVILKSAAATAERLGEGLLRVYAPKQAMPAMRDLGFGGGEHRDPWLRKEIVRMRKD